MNFHSDTLLLTIYDQEMGNYEFLYKFAVVVQLLANTNPQKIRTQKLPVMNSTTTSVRILSCFLTKKTCTKVVAVLTIRNVWVICSLVLIIDLIIIFKSMVLM